MTCKALNKDKSFIILNCFSKNIQQIMFKKQVKCNKKNKCSLENWTFSTHYIRSEKFWLHFCWEKLNKIVFVCTYRLIWMNRSRSPPSGSKINCSEATNRSSYHPTPRQSSAHHWNKCSVRSPASQWLKKKTLKEHI